MDREIDDPSAASRGQSARRLLPARSLRHLGVLVSAAAPLLVLVAWAITGLFHDGRNKVAAEPPTRPVGIASVVPALRSTARRAPARPQLDAFTQESRMSPAELLNRWSPDIAKASHRLGVPQSWIRAVMGAESGGRTMAAMNRPLTSSMGAVGLMQLMPGTYAEMREQYDLGPDPFVPHDNIVAAAAYLRWLYLRYGYPTMFAAYDDGPGNLEQRLIDGRTLPLETQLYVANVTGSPRIARVIGARSLAAFTRPDGTQVEINGFAVNSIRAPLPGEYAPGVNAVIGMGKLKQGVRESITEATAVLRRHGAFSPALYGRGTGGG